MARPIYSYELEDPDFSWLLTKYKENHPNCCSVEATCLPVVLICVDQLELPEERSLVPVGDKDAQLPAIRGGK